MPRIRWGRTLRESSRKANVAYYEHGGGKGDAVFFDDYQSGTVYGFKADIPRPGDYLFTSMESGRVLVSRFTRVTLAGDPKDMFQGRVEHLGNYGDVDVDVAPATRHSCPLVERLTGDHSASALRLKEYELPDELGMIVRLMNLEAPSVLVSGFHPKVVAHLAGQRLTVDGIVNGLERAMRDYLVELSPSEQRVAFQALTSNAARFIRAACPDTVGAQNAVRLFNTRVDSGRPGIAG
jgi:hypothetical protein